MEKIEETANRALLQKLGVAGGMVELAPSRIKTIESEEHSDFYPGLTTVVSRHFIQARVVTSDRKLLEKVGLRRLESSTETEEEAFETEYSGETFRWIWQKPEDVAGLRGHLGFLKTKGNHAEPGAVAKAKSGKVSMKFGKSQSEKLKRSSLLRTRDASLQVILPWRESAVQELLLEYHATAEEFGLSLQELSAEASQGRLAFATNATHGNDKKLVAITDFVLLQLLNPEGKGVLMQYCSDEGSTETALPEIAWHLDECSWDAARRLGRSMLFLEDEVWMLHNDLTKLQREDLVSQRMIKRRWLVSAAITEDVKHMQ